MINPLKPDKSILKKSQTLSIINQYIKSHLLKAHYKRINHYYKSINNKSIKHNLPRISNSALNILFLGSDYQQDYGGMLQSLQSLGKVTAFTKKDGSYGMTPANGLTSLNAFDANTQRLLEIIKQMKASKNIPHIIIGQMWGAAFDTSIFDNIRHQDKTIVINIAMDDRHTYWGDSGAKRWMGTYGLIPHVDLVLTAAPECVEWYSKEGCPAIFFPEASDPNIFHPMPELPKIYDVSFIGARYGIRGKIIQALRNAGISVSAYGSEWEGGRLPIQDVPRLFAQSKIILGIGTIGHCSDFYALKLRDFDAPMSGSFYLTHDNPDLHTLFTTGKEIETYQSIEDCIAKVRYYLAHDTEREAIAYAGRQRAISEHTWNHRFNTLLDTLKEPT